MANHHAMEPCITGCDYNGYKCRIKKYCDKYKIKEKKAVLFMKIKPDCFLCCDCKNCPGYNICNEYYGDKHDKTT